MPFTAAQELLKLLMCLAVLGATRRDAGPLFTLPFRSVLLYSLPALFYTFTNNVVVLAQACVHAPHTVADQCRYVDPISFQLLSNLKIITTAILYRLLIRTTPFTRYQWAAFILLTASGALVTSSIAAQPRRRAEHVGHARTQPQKGSERDDGDDGVGDKRRSELRVGDHGAVRHESALPSHGLNAALRRRLGPVVLVRARHHTLHRAQVRPAARQQLWRVRWVAPHITPWRAWRAGRPASACV